jgi:Zn-dependent protease with chaperone function
VIGALAGFALVFVVTCVTLSALAAVVLGALRHTLARRGPMVERRAAAISAIVPVFVAASAVSILVAQSAFGVDHCFAHDDHAHLCLAHGAAWLDRSWVLVMLAVAASTFVARAVIVAVSYLRGAHSIRALSRMSTRRGDVRIVDSDRAFCFVTRRGVFVSSRVWTALPEAERAALVAHEQAHLRHGDLAMRVVIELLLLFAAPLAGDRVRALWLRACERLCDEHAASETAPETVAQAMVSMCRLGTAQPTLSFGFTPTAAELAARIEAVLARVPLGERLAIVVSRATVASCLALVVVAIAAAEPLHHAFETLLG